MKYRDLPRPVDAPPQALRDAFWDFFVRLVASSGEERDQIKAEMKAFYNNEGGTSVAERIEMFTMQILAARSYKNDSELSPQDLPGLRGEFKSFGK